MATSSKQTSANEKKTKKDPPTKHSKELLRAARREKRALVAYWSHRLTEKAMAVLEEDDSATSLRKLRRLFGQFGSAVLEQPIEVDKKPSDRDQRPGVGDPYCPPGKVYDPEEEECVDSKEEP